MKKRSVVALVTILLAMVLCVSVVSARGLGFHDLIQKPKSYCKLEKVPRKIAKLEDISLYDESNCYDFWCDKIFGFDLKEKVQKNAKTYLGDFRFQNEPRFRETFHFIMPFSVKLPYGTNFKNTNLCVEKTPNDGYYIPSYESYSGTSIVKIIQKRKLSNKERIQFLENKQGQLDEEWRRANERKREEYNACIDRYNTLVNVWETETSAKKFCIGVENTWFSRNCLGTEDDNTECKTLRKLFTDCYQQELIHVDDTYVFLHFYMK